MRQSCSALRLIGYFTFRAVCWDNLREVEKPRKELRDQKSGFYRRIWAPSLPSALQTDNLSTGAAVKWRGDNIYDVSFDFRRKTSVCEPGAEA